MQKRILVVDDEPHLIRSLTFILSREGYEVDMACDGEEALKKVSANKPDLMFLDIMMPKKNGYEVCEAIRNDPALKDIYIIILSAKGWDIDREKAMHVGANEFISKPFSPMDAVSRTKKALNTPSFSNTA
ncbi:MAG: response regulator [Dehalococcoidales bacterium]|nr:response regulator [Dehalococcoidales bacterium]